MTAPAPQRHPGPSRVAKNASPANFDWAHAVRHLSEGSCASLVIVRQEFAISRLNRQRIFPDAVVVLLLAT
jgi:hypothetical protein